MCGRTFCRVGVTMVVKFWKNNIGKTCIVSLLFIVVVLGGLVDMFGLPVLELLSDATVDCLSCFLPLTW